LEQKFFAELFFKKATSFFLSFFTDPSMWRSRLGRRLMGFASAQPILRHIEG
jgi:hypothetical protein